MPIGFAHPHIRIADIARSLDFYCKRLGLVEIARLVEAHYTLIYLAAPGDIAKAPNAPAPMLELSYVHDGPPITDGTRFGHIAFHVDDLGETCAQLAKDGVTVSVAPQPQGFAYIVTPDGMTIELLQRRPDATGDPSPSVLG
ncbi:VOC family protein [Sphingomonas crocodyli]|uniref:Lactoylglutathione lyase n=1 Tax=Sphingomonas crocodyli TaxID=1979270 RepID=A0A437LYM2_9SPHN|nr:VOC family protein [Sphingomonas crocodyli]RVT90465.1 lactoylglutathione lyase [Sphingomonas crocodyli]